MLFTMAVLSQFANAAEVEFGDTAVRVVEKVYLPAYSEFNSTADNLVGAIKLLCQGASFEQLKEVRDAYGAVVQSFSVIEFYRIGPMLIDNRQNRLFYWPDKRRVGERQLRAMLQESNTGNAVSKLNIAGKSVAVQGLPALERLLYDSRAGEQLTDVSSRRCNVALVVAFNIATMASELEHQWSAVEGIADRIRNPRDSDEQFRTHREVIRSFMTQISAGSEFLVARKLEPLLPGDSSETSKSSGLRTMRKMPFWKSENYLTNLRGNVEGIRALVIDSGLAERANIADELTFEFKVAVGYIKSLDSISSLVLENTSLDPDAQGLLAALASVLRSIQLSVSDRLASKLGVHAGFNSDDGD
ncbi:hypothetical protein AB833_08930 [Chromatiales bacterium (ex Bugula neritina AB1)]|nr:hypothetical protein AB833_08930 [Chromatiales bacterium (ex Bugula neritina AB1)]